MKKHSSFFKKYSGNNIDVIKLKESVNVVAFYQEEGQEISTKGGRWRKAGICPFHEDQEAGSFYIHCESGAFKCFSCDNKGRDIIAFVQKKYDLSFPGAVSKLAKEWRVS